jgi:uncharacterized repeat protein (TIGR02543 family)
MPILYLLLATLVAVFAASAAYAQTAVFTLQDKTNLPAGTYQIYVTGFSTPGPYALQADGSWATPATPTGTATLPCWRFPQDITKVQINSAQTSISARVYYFVVTDTTAFPSCNPTSGTGLFNQQGVGSAFTYTSIAGLNLTMPTVTSVGAKTFPAWTFSEIGASSANGTIDLSQVDFLAFPANTVATVTAGATPANPSTMGNPVGTTANPNDAVNHLTMRDSYSAYINGLAEAGNNNQSCGKDATPAVCAYLDLLQNIRTGGSGVPEYIIQNPGGYLGQYSSTTQQSGLNTVFDTLIGKLWTTSNPPTLTIQSGGAFGSIPNDVFTSSIVTINYPNSTYAVKAMKFTGTATSGNYVAYVFSPLDYQNGCNAGSILTQYCSLPASTGYQVFAGAGALGPPLSDTYTQLCNANLLLPACATAPDAGDYNALVARLGFLISGAMNRGAAMVACAGNTWTCWQDETYWYPTAVSSTFPDITQNQFSRWMHTATIGGTSMFVRPPSAVKSASTTAGTGKPMGMAYGFSNDENPTPPAVSPPQAEVPSKFDQTVVYGGAGPYTITFGPWVGTLPTLAVTTLGSGSVTSSPAGINCDPTCSQSYPMGTTVVLTAQPSPTWVFAGWSGACTGHSTTCTVTVNGTTTAHAEFGQILAAPSGFGLHVVVHGTGTVTSTPAGIACGATCSNAFGANTSVTLSAASAAGWTFAGWTGACSGAGASCTVSMSESRTVGASFVHNTHFTLAVTAGSNGVVTTTPGGIDCGTRCIAGFAAGTTINVIARPNPGYRFSGWSGACSGTNTCDLTMSANRSVQAAFAAVAPGHYALTVHDYGEGTIVSAPAGINCGATCTAAYATGTEVTLLASPAPGYQFAGWTGACTGTGACVVWMDNLAHVNATFTPSAILAADNPIPTLSQWALLLLTLLMAGVACRHWSPRAARADKTR